MLQLSKPSPIYFTFKSFADDNPCLLIRGIVHPPSQMRETWVLKLRFETRTMNVNRMTGGALLSVSDPHSRFPNYIRQLVEIEGTTDPDRKGPSNDVTWKLGAVSLNQCICNNLEERWRFPRRYCKGIIDFVGDTKNNDVNLLPVLLFCFLFRFQRA